MLKTMPVSNTSSEAGVQPSPRIMVDSSKAYAVSESMFELAFKTTILENISRAALSLLLHVAPE